MKKQCSQGINFVLDCPDNQLESLPVCYVLHWNLAFVHLVMNRNTSFSWGKNFCGDTTSCVDFVVLLPHKNISLYSALYRNRVIILSGTWQHVVPFGVLPVCSIARMYPWSLPELLQCGFGQGSHSQHRRVHGFCQNLLKDFAISNHAEKLEPLPTQILIITTHTVVLYQVGTVLFISNKGCQLACIHTMYPAPFCGILAKATLAETTGLGAREVGWDLHWQLQLASGSAVQPQLLRMLVTWAVHWPMVVEYHTYTYKEETGVKVPIRNWLTPPENNDRFLHRRKLQHSHVNIHMFTRDFSFKHCWTDYCHSTEAKDLPL